MDATPRYVLRCIGIGDLILFCSFVMKHHKKGSTIKIRLDQKILQNFRNNSEEYKNFCLEFIQYILDDYIIHILDNNDDLINYIHYIWDHNYLNLYKNVINNQIIVDHIKNKFVTDQNIYSDFKYLVLFTKVRNLNFKTYKNISPEFFQILNKTNYKFILLGERDVEYKGEYAIHGETQIYSLYQDYINNLNSDRIIDLTEKNYEFSGFSVKNIVHDMNLISNSEGTIIFGGGGFFCLSLFTSKLISLTNPSIQTIFNPTNAQNIFSQSEHFLTYMNSLI